MKALLDALEAVDMATAEAAVDEHCSGELDAIVEEITTRLERLDAEGRLTSAIVDAAETEFMTRASDLAQQFAINFFDALVGAAVAVDAAQTGISE